MFSPETILCTSSATSEPQWPH